MPQTPDLVAFLLLLTPVVCGVIIVMALFEGLG